jgi:hypothetical protein
VSQGLLISRRPFNLSCTVLICILVRYLPGHRLSVAEGARLLRSLFIGGTRYLSSSRKCGLSSDWQEYIHPEGQSYFVHARRSAPRINVITDAHASDSEVQNAVSDFADKLLTRAVSDFWTLDPVHVELMIDVDVDDPAASCYYFIDHENAVVFWLDEVSADDIDIPEVSGIGHLRELHRFNDPLKGLSLTYFFKRYTSKESIGYIKNTSLVIRRRQRKMNAS